MAPAAHTPHPQVWSEEAAEFTATAGTPGMDSDWLASLLEMCGIPNYETGGC